MKANQNKKEEIANAITHGLGAALAIAALVLLVVFSVIKGNTWHVVSFSIFGASLVILYLASTLYHSFSNPRVKAFFKKLDHMSIFVLIAGTYTPFCIAVLQNWIGWTFFGIVWGCTILGIVIKAFHTGKKEVLSTILYVLMGWIIVFAIKPLYNAISFQAFLFLIIGGILYSVGTFFFINNKIKYNHSITIASGIYLCSAAVPSISFR
jgi:hemolysin III